MAVGGSDLPPPLEAFLAAAHTLDVLLSPHQYRGSGEVARQLRAAAAAEPAAVGAFAAALFAKVKSFPEAAAALAAASGSGGTVAASDGGSLLDCLLRQLDPVLLALKHLGRPAERARIPTKLMLGCLAKLEPVEGAPDFLIDRYGLGISPLAVCPDPFAWHVDHHVPLACCGATDATNLDAVQHRFNHYKRDRLIDPELHRWEILRQMAPHTYVTAGQLQQLVAQLEAQGKEPSYRTVMALLRCTEPWNAHYAGSSGGSSSEAAVQSEVGRLAQGRRGRQDWSAKEEEKLAAAVFHASKRALEELRRGVRTGRISWKRVAAELGSGRSNKQCRDKWRGPRLAADAPEDESGQESDDESDEEDGAQRQQPQRGYNFWSEAEADAAAQLLGAVGARLERDRSFAMTARSLPDKLRSACEELWHMPLDQRLPGHTAAKVARKCCDMAAFAIKLARSKVLFEQQQANRGLTVQQWCHIAPHLLLLPEQLPLKSEVRQLAASEEHRQELQRFVKDPPRDPRKGGPRLPPLRDYWRPDQQAPAAAPEAAAAEATGTAQGAGRVAARGQGASVTAVQPRSGTAAASSGSAAGSRPAGAAARVAAATPAGSSQSADDVIDLTQSDSDGRDALVENVPRHGPPAASSTMGAVGRGGGDPPSSSRSSSSGCGDGRGSGGSAGQSSSGSTGRSGGRSSNSSSRGRGSSQAAPERAVLAEANQQLAAATASERRRYRKTTEAERQGIYKLWLRSPDKWEQIRQQVERDPALCSFLEGCRDKKQAQVRLKDLGRKWSLQADLRGRAAGGSGPATSCMH